jgi:hypothetical protein
VCVCAALNEEKIALHDSAGIKTFSSIFFSFFLSLPLFHIPLTSSYIFTIILCRTCSANLIWMKRLYVLTRWWEKIICSLEFKSMNKPCIK